MWKIVIKFECRATFKVSIAHSNIPNIPIAVSSVCNESLSKRHFKFISIWCLILFLRVLTFYLVILWHLRSANLVEGTRHADATHGSKWDSQNKKVKVLFSFHLNFKQKLRHKGQEQSRESRAGGRGGGRRVWQCADAAYGDLRPQPRAHQFLQH